VEGYFCATVARRASDGLNPSDTNPVSVSVVVANKIFISLSLSSLVVDGVVDEMSLAFDD
jgi:hypothetical protein